MKRLANLGFEQWIKSDAPGERFICFHLQVSRSVWEDAFLPRCLTRFRAERVVRITSEEDWEEVRYDLCQPSLFSRRILVLLEEVGSRLAMSLWEEKKLGADTTVLYLLRELPGKWWAEVPIVMVSATDRQFLENLIHRCGRAIHPQALGILVRLWRDYDLKPSDITQWVKQLSGKNSIEAGEVESYFERSEKVLLFGFLDAASSRDLSLAYRMFTGLMKIGYPPPLVLSHLARRFRLMLQALETKELKVDLWKGTKLSPFEFNKIKKNAGKYTVQQIKAIFAALSRVDWQLKSQSIPFDLLMLDFFTAVPIERASRRRSGGWQAVQGPEQTRSLVRKQPSPDSTGESDGT
ncbi:MAG TPA: hypothetical protein VLH40_05440 [Atribacteraceae bacterium]|nr:hypothetical protein [Atribacteraceae bacterium]